MQAGEVVKQYSVVKRPRTDTEQGGGGDGKETKRRVARDAQLDSCYCEGNFEYGSGGGGSSLLNGFIETSIPISVY
jgi:hypothetical protein